MRLGDAVEGASTKVECSCVDNTEYGYQHNFFDKMAKPKYGIILTSGCGIVKLEFACKVG